MMRARALFPWLAVVAAPLAAQSAPPDPPPQAPSGQSLVQRIASPGKWVAGAASVALIALAVKEHARSNDSWDALTALCREDNQRCVVTPDGAYRDLEAERLYQESQYYDRRAQRRILGGQAALVLAGALLIIDLSDRRAEPNNVPFDPDRAYVAPAKGGGVLLGVRLTF
jgi:hypothetical protein